jgi:hypothetical protein
VAISDAGWYPLPPGGAPDLPPGKLTFHMPLGWHAATMGKLVSQDRNADENVETFQAPVNRRRAFIAAAYKIRQTDSPTGTNTFYQLDAPIDAASLLKAFDHARQFLEARYGPLPFRDYRLAEMPNDAVPWYGVSEPGFIVSRNEMMKTEQGLLGNFVHELAHSWWGNKVQHEGKGSYLLNEGMAAFSGMEFLESTGNKEQVIEDNVFGSAEGSPDATIYGYMQLWRAGKDKPISQLEVSVGDHYNISQTKGVWVLRMLSDRMGQERFNSALRQIIASSPTLTLAQFRSTVTETRPDDHGLRAFLAQWLDQQGIPVLEVRWRNETRDERTRAIISIFQAQPDALYELHLDLKLKTRRGILRRTVEVQGVESHFDFEVPGELVGVELDPDHKLLIWRPELGPAPVVAH